MAGGHDASVTSPSVQPANHGSIPVHEWLVVACCYPSAPREPAGCPAHGRRGCARRCHWGVSARRLGACEGEAPCPSRGAVLSRTHSVARSAAAPCPVSDQCCVPLSVVVMHLI